MEYKISLPDGVVWPGSGSDPGHERRLRGDAIALFGRAGIRLKIVFWSGQGGGPQTPKGKITDPA